MTAVDIRRGIIRLLRDNTDVPHITGEEIEAAKDYHTLAGDGDEIILPTFQVNVQPVSGKAAAAGYHMKKSVFVDISYMEARYTSRKALKERLEELQGILLPVLMIGDRAFSPVLSFDITDGIGHCMFPLEWTDTVSFEEKEPSAEKMEIRL